jgi:hypothetical protein
MQAAIGSAPLAPLEPLDPLAVPVVVAVGPELEPLEGSVDPELVPTSGPGGISLEHPSKSALDEAKVASPPAARTRAARWRRFGGMRAAVAQSNLRTVAGRGFLPAK